MLTLKEMYVIIFTFSYSNTIMAFDNRKTNYHKMKDSIGRWRTQSLFYEFARNGTEECLFTIKPYDSELNGRVFPSLRLIYMSYDHVPGYEYDFANEVLGGWDHWTQLCKNKMIAQEISAWREEKEVELKARAIRAMIKVASSEGSKGLPAAKYLADGHWKGVRGRPSKGELERERKIAAGLEDEISDDLLRVGLTLVANGKK